MPQEMVVDYALNEIEAEPRHEVIFDLFVEEQEIEFLGFHD